MFRFHFEALTLFPLFIFLFMVVAVAVFKGMGTYKKIIWSIVSLLFFIVLSFATISLSVLGMNPELLLDFGLPSQGLIAFIACAVVAVGFFVASVFKSIHALAISLLSFLVWWSFQANAWLGANGIEQIYLIVGFVTIGALYYTLGYLHQGKYKKFSNLYLSLGFSILLSALIFASIKPGLVAIGLMTEGASILTSVPLTATFILMLALFFGVATYGLRKKRLSLYEFLIITGVVDLFVIIAAMSVQRMFIHEMCLEEGMYLTCTMSGVGSIWAIIFNLVLFLQVFGLFLFGFLRKERLLINFGSFCLLLLIVVKYFDWFFDDIPNQTILFAGAGVLLIVSGWLIFSKRRYMLSKMG